MSKCVIILSKLSTFPQISIKKIKFSCAGKIKCQEIRIRIKQSFQFVFGYEGGRFNQITKSRIYNVIKILFFTCNALNVKTFLLMCAYALPLNFIQLFYFSHIVI